MSKPVDLIVANVMHDGASFGVMTDDFIQQAYDVVGRKANKSDIAEARKRMAEMMARKLLCEISHHCSMKMVMTALKAVNAPCSVADILDGLQAVEDSNK